MLLNGARTEVLFVTSLTHNTFLRTSAKAIFANILPEDLFRADVSDARVRKLFGEFVRTVEVETHSYCNRTCWFCPNATLDRLSENHFMADGVYDKVLSGLEEIDYRRVFIIARYSEPLAHESVFERVAEARRRLPHASLRMISNADYLNKEKLAKLAAAGLDRLNLNIYTPAGEERNPEAVTKYLAALERRSGIAVDWSSPYQFRTRYERIEIALQVPYYGHGFANTVSRGGLVQLTHTAKFQRTSACFLPIHTLVIDSNGKGMLCCQTRSDAPQHAGAVIGDLSVPGYTLFDYYRDLGPHRRYLVTPEVKKGVCESCTFCNTSPVARKKVAVVLGSLPGVERATARAMDSLYRQQLELHS